MSPSHPWPNDSGPPNGGGSGWLTPPLCRCSCDSVRGDRSASARPWDLDHRLPRSKGGTNHPANLRVLHRRCNRLSSRRLAWESTQRKRREAEAQASARWAPLPVVRRVAPEPPALVEVERSRIF